MPLDIFRKPEKRTSDTDWHEIVKAHYANALESLNGKEFHFSPLFNVIVGENGSGKTTLLKAIRALSLCPEGEMHSTTEIPYWNLTLERESYPYFGFCEMKSDYRRCLYGLVRDEDLNRHSGINNIKQFAQAYEGSAASKGEKGIIALSTLMREFAEGKGRSVSDPENERGMEKHALGNIKDYLTKFGDRESDPFAPMLKTILDYHKRNQVDDARRPFLLDEPDCGFDVFKAKTLCDLLERMADDAEKNIIQPIVVLHNVAIIKRLMNKQNVNFIELTPGYVEAIKNF